MKINKAIKPVLIITTILLMILPAVVTFNDILTRIFEKFSIYILLQDYAVPLEVKIVGFVVRLYGISYTPLSTGMFVNARELHMEWNCLGWQSLLLFGISVIAALWGKRYTMLSVGETIFLGIFSVFWINILRISILVFLFVYAEPVYTYLFHDFFAAVVSIIWLIFFWWFAYKYLLELRYPQQNISK